jgi:hypothetical protein
LLPGWKPSSGHCFSHELVFLTPSSHDVSVPPAHDSVLPLHAAGAEPSPSFAAGAAPESPFKAGAGPASPLPPEEDGISPPPSQAMRSNNAAGAATQAPVRWDVPIDLKNASRFMLKGDGSVET